VQAVADDAGVDLVVAYALHEPAGTLPEVVLPPIAHAIDKPLLFGTMGPSQELPATIQALRKEGMYVAESPERLAHAAIVLVRDAEQQERLKRPREQAARLPDVDLPELTDEHVAKNLLDTIGVPTPGRVVASSHAEAFDALRRLGGPVAAKILSAEITHKTEAGGVHLDIEDEAGLRAALALLDAVPVRSDRRYLIEAMAAPGLELIVGATRDVSFGPTVTVGLGGTLTEVLKDTVTRLAPLTASQAEEMLDELRAARLFDGFRGGPRLNRRAVANVVATLGCVLCRHQSVAALEVNPLRVYEHGVLALDAVLITSASA
jgi:acetyltransferase